MLELVTATKYTVYLAAFGWTSLKPLAVWTNHDARLARSLLGCPRRDAEQALLTSDADATPLYTLGPRATQRKRTDDGSEKRTGWRQTGWINSTSSQSASKEYPARFCSVAADLAALSLPL